MSDPLDWLKGPAHECGPRCGHNAGIETEKKVRPESPVVPSMGNSGMVPRGADQTIQPYFQTDPDALCEDCSCPLKDHMGSKGNCVYCACKSFVPVGPKQ